MRLDGSQRTMGRVHSMSSSGEWIVRGVDAAIALGFLQRYQPWRMELKFENGPSASDGPTFEPFNRAPLNKLRILMEHIPHDSIRGARVLDIGFNAGYNSLFLAQAFDAQVTGIDVARRHKTLADELASITEVKVEFLLASAEEFEMERTFDLILHLGTLYHLANPVRSLEHCFRSLKVNGWFALETICYRGSSDRNCCKWIRGLGGDKTNFWALGEGAIESIASYCGISGLRLVLEAWPDVYQGEMSRALWIGCRR